jgi:hypothetical protein
MFASISARGFFDPEIHTSMPNDAIEMPEGLHATLMNGQSEGKIITWGKEGLPYLAERPALTTDELNTIALSSRETAYRLEADPLFFQVQRGDVENQVWLDKIAEIKARYPKV